MAETIQLLNHLFSTADAGGVDFSCSRGDLTLLFTDWREIPNEILFPDIEFFSLDHRELEDDRFRFDSPHEILDSEAVRQRQLDPGQVHHYMLCFNAGPTIEIISGQLVVVKPVESESSPDPKTRT